MSEDVLAPPPPALPASPSSPWPELAELDDFWETDATPPRGIPCVGVDDVDDDDPTPVNAPRPVLAPTLPPPTTPPVAGPPPVATAEPLSLPTGAPLTTPSFADPQESTRRRWPRRLGAVAIIAGLVAAGVFAWQWNEGRHDAASAARVLPSGPVQAPDLNLVEIDLDRSVDVSFRADLETGDALAVVSADLSIARSDKGVWIREPGADEWTPATAAFLERNALVVGLIENASILTVTDVLPAAVHPHLRIVDDVSVVDSGVVSTGPGVLDMDGDGNVRHLIIDVDRNALRAAEPVLATQLNLADDGFVEIEIWLDRTGVVRRLSSPTDVTIVGGEYRLVSAEAAGAGPLDQFAPGTFVAPSPASADPVTDPSYADVVDAVSSDD